MLFFTFLFYNTKILATSFVVISLLPRVYDFVNILTLSWKLRDTSTQIAESSLSLYKGRNFLRKRIRKRVVYFHLTKHVQNIRRSN